MHEFDQMVHYWRAAQLAGQRLALASIVHVSGSSYRKPGARMLVSSSGSMHGAVSGGCVERAVAAVAEEVFRSDIPQMLVYDGRLRLGCEGTLYILVEPFAPEQPDAFFGAFAKTRSAKQRSAVLVKTSAIVDATSPEPSPIRSGCMGTTFYFSTEGFAARPGILVNCQEDLFIFEDRVEPAPRLYVIGAEHDAVALAKLAASLQFEVGLVNHPSNPLAPIPGIEVFAIDPAELLSHISLDSRTAVVLMNHNFARDLAYLEALTRCQDLSYLGLLGPRKRREQLFDALFERGVVPPVWMENHLYGPAGLDLGAELPEHIALSIMAEIVAVWAGRNVPSLRDKRSSIHSPN